MVSPFLWSESRRWVWRHELAITLPALFGSPLCMHTHTHTPCMRAVPNDFYRYTTDGATELFTSAGFEIVRLHRGGEWGPMALGFLMGFGTGDFDRAKLNEHMIGPDLSNTSARASGSGDEAPNMMPNKGIYVSVLVIARKPAL